MRKLAIVVVLLALAEPSSACRFQTDLKFFQPNASAFQPKIEEDRTVALLPAPSIRLKSIERGTAAPGVSCDDAGIIKVVVTWPGESAYTIDEIGFYFRVSGRGEEKYIFPRIPVVSSRITGNEIEFMFVWLDGHPNQQDDLDFLLEVFAVNQGLEVGKSANLRVHHEAG